ncbi:MAG: divergent polysaccharide deacetylase family protein, partial [Nannocystaceae bacterium]|nr:divergent polysaccharide deacetylase family protein [Nannocystaceae bacterium]
DAVMSELARRRVFFLDSRTTADTVAMEAATAAQVPTGSRHVFLDHEPGVAAIAHALALAAERASREPTIAIAHPTPEVAEVLAKALPRLRAQGVGIYPLSAVLRARSDISSPRALQGR